MKKRMITGIALVLCLCLLAGCKAPDTEPTTSETAAEPAAFEAVVETVLVSDRLEVKVLSTEYSGMLFINTKNLELPKLTKGARILVTYDPSDLLSDGYVEKVFELGVLEEPPEDPSRLLKGSVVAFKEDYLQLRVSTNSTVAMFYVKRLPLSQELQLGDLVQVRYIPGNNPAQLDDVQEILLLEKADWGFSMRASDVTPTGLQLWMGAASGFPRVLTTTEAFTLEKPDGDTWVSVPKLPGKDISNAPVAVSGGDIYTVSWEAVYGSLAPGKYRLSRVVSYEGESRSFSVEFTVPGPVSSEGLINEASTAPLPSELETELNKTVRYIISKRLVNPPRPHDKTMEQIPQSENTGFLDDPTTSLPVGKTFEQITESHMILDYQQEGKLHIFSIAAYCCGYNNRQLDSSCFDSMRLTIRENEDGSYTATSCMIPTRLSTQADTELLFAPEIAQRLREDWMLRDTLSQACNRQLTFQTLEVKGFGQTFKAGSTEATLIENAVKAGKKLQKAYEDSYVSTLYVGDTVYYFYFKKGVIHNAIDNIYIQLTKEGSKAINTIFQSTDEE